MSVCQESAAGDLVVRKKRVKIVNSPLQEIYQNSGVNYSPIVTIETP
jgi:hypothetical protein